MGDFRKNRLRFCCFCCFFDRSVLTDVRKEHRQKTWMKTKSIHKVNLLARTCFRSALRRCRSWRRSATSASPTRPSYPTVSISADFVCIKNFSPCKLQTSYFRIFLFFVLFSSSTLYDDDLRTKFQRDFNHSQRESSKHNTHFVPRKITLLDFANDWNVSLYCCVSRDAQFKHMLFWSWTGHSNDHLNIPHFCSHHFKTICSLIWIWLRRLPLICTMNVWCCR